MRSRSPSTSRRPGRSFGALLPYAWPLALLGLVNTAVPFFLIAWGQQYIDSGLAAIFNASAPLFTALFAVAYDQSQRVTGMRLAGVVLGFGGVVLLVGFELSRRRARRRRRPRRGRRVRLLRARRPLRGPPLPRPAPSLVAFGTLVWATLFVLPFGVAQASSLGWEALASVLYLGVAATGVAYLLYFGLIAGAGASKAVLVTYLVPSLALVYGAVFLDENVTALSLAGLALVLAGVALGTGSVREVNRYAPMLFVLAAVWGASYLFIKVAVDEVAPAPMMAMRTLLAAAVLITYVVWRFGWERTRAEARAARGATSWSSAPSTPRFRSG